MTADRYERVGKLVAEQFADGPGIGSRQVVVYRCPICAALVDADHFSDHHQWHVKLDQHGHPMAVIGHGQTRPVE